MWCPFCGAEKEPGVWTCQACGVAIAKPSRAPYKAHGWEWIAALVCLGILLCAPSVNPPSTGLELLRVTVSCASLAFAFSATRDLSRRSGHAGALCLGFWIGSWGVVGGAAFAGYLLLILGVEYVVWQAKLART